MALASEKFPNYASWASINFNLFEISSNLSSCIPSVLLLCISTHAHIILQPIHLLKSSVISALFNLAFYHLWLISIKYLEIFIPLKNEKSYKEVCWFPSIEISLLRTITSFPPQSYKSPRKTATRRLIEQQFRNRRVRHILCERTPRPSRNEFTSIHWGYKFCGSQLCSPSREQRYYGLIELQRRTFVRKLVEILP